MSMSTSSYAFSERALAHAIHCLDTQPTSYEGLYRAYVESLQWIDPSKDVPASNRDAFIVWRNKLLPVPTTPGALVSLLDNLRRLSPAQARKAARRLRQIADAVKNCP